MTSLINNPRTPTKSSIKKALLSASNKTGLVDFAKQLATCGIDIIATGGTAALLQDSKISTQEVSHYTNSPEIMNGRVKTLHPKIHGGLLARQGIDDETIKQHDIELIDLVIVNLYPFKQTIAQQDCSHQNAIENIDIGGPTMIRAAAKNYERVTIVIDPHDYPRVLEEIRQLGNTSLQTRHELAAKAFAHTADYDAAVAAYFQKYTASTQQQPLPSQLNTQYHKTEDLRYGENPHQAAALYTSSAATTDATQPQLLQGKPLSFNNIMDSETAIRCALDLDPQQPACVIVKHATPCGGAVASSQIKAYQKAYQTDSTSAFGGIVAFNQSVTADTVNTILDQQFVEVLIAPDFTADALTLCQKKPNLRVLACGHSLSEQSQWSLHAVSAGLLVQQTDTHQVQADNLHIVSQRQPTNAEIADLLFCWRMAKFVKSNAIVYAKDQATLGIGSGQTSRVFSAQIAILKAEQAGLSLEQAVMASDAFFPFADSINIAAEAGITAVIQPGGSKRDPEVIAAADAANMAMVLTGIRHFRH